MPIEFTFGQIEAVCVGMNDISPDKRTAFVSRLKHLINPGKDDKGRDKPGILYDERNQSESRPGRGKAAKFTFSQLMKVVIGVELLQAGTPPALAAKLVQGNWMQLRLGVHFALYNEVEKLKADDPRQETFWLLAPEALRDLSAAGEGRFDHYEAFESIYTSEALMRHFAMHRVGGMRGHYRRQLILNGTAITRAATFIIWSEMNIATIRDLQEAIYEEIMRDQRALDQAVEEMAKGELSDDSLSKLEKMVPVFQEFDERWAEKVFQLADKLTPIQHKLFLADPGDDVEILPDDFTELRNLDLIDVEQGDLVVTELGQDVATELKRRAGIPDSRSPRTREKLEHAAEILAAMKERKRDDRPVMYPVELAVLLSALNSDGQPQGEMSISTAKRKRRPKDGDQK